MTPLPLIVHAAQPRPLRVLVADDYTDAADSLATLMEMAGCEVRVAYDGEVAERVAAEFEPDVCLVDLRMPGQDGWDVARQLRASRGPDEILLVAVSGLHDREAVECSREAGFDCHLIKPVGFDKLHARLAEFAGRERELATVAG